MTLNIRKSADVTSELLGEIPDKTVLSVLDINNNWAKIEYKGISGWVCMDYLTKVAN